jgi:carbon storage regulator
MLVLSRRRDESIVVGTNVEIRILEIRGNQVRLGIVAPKSIPVNRKEVFESICSVINSPAEKNVSYELQAV